MTKIISLISSAVKDKVVLYSMMGTVWRVLFAPVSLTLVAIKFTEEMLGVYYVFFSIAGLQAIIEAGFSHTIIQSISHEMHGASFSKGILNGTEECKNNIFQALRLGFTWFTGVGLACILIVMPIGFLIIGNNTPLYADLDWQFPWVVFILCFSLNIILYPVNFFFEGTLHLEKIYFIRLIIQIISSVIFVCLLFLGCELYVTAVNACVSVIINFIVLFLPNREIFLKQFRFPTKKYFKKIFQWQMKISLVWCSGYLYWQLPTIILFSTLGPVISGQYGMTVNITNAINNFGQVFIRTKTALIGKLRAEGNFIEAFKIYKSNSILSYATVTTGVIALLCLYFIIPDFIVWKRMMPLLPALILIFAFAINLITLNQAMFARCSKEEPYFSISMFTNFGFPLVLLAFVYFMPNYWGIVLPFVIMHGIELIWGSIVFKRLFNKYL